MHTYVLSLLLRVVVVVVHITSLLLRVGQSSHLQRFLFPRQEDFIQDCVVAFRASLFSHPVLLHDLLLPLLRRFQLHLSHLHLLLSQTFMSFHRFQVWKFFNLARLIERPLDVFLHRFLAQLGDASRRKLWFSPLLIAKESGYHRFWEFREVLSEFSRVAIHLLFNSIALRSCLFLSVTNFFLRFVFQKHFRITKKLCAYRRSLSLSLSLSLSSETERIK